MAASDGADKHERVPEEDGSETTQITFGLVNGILMRKVSLNMVVYPEIADQVKQVVQVHL